MQDVLRVTFSKLLAHTPKKCKHCGSATFSVSQEYNSQLSATRSPSCFMQAPNGQTDRCVLSFFILVILILMMLIIIMILMMMLKMKLDDDVSCK